MFVKRIAACIAAAVATMAIAACNGETDRATKRTATTALLNGKGDCYAGENGEWWFRYRKINPTGAWQETSPRNPFNCATDRTNVPLSEVATGLTRGTTYQFNLAARERDGAGNWDTPGYCNANATCTQGSSPPGPYDTFTTRGRLHN